MSNVVQFNPKEDTGIDQEIRVVGKDDGPWFVAKDVCEALGITNARDSVRKSMSVDESQHLLKSNVEQTDIKIPNRGLTIISESGLYKLIMRSDKPQARPFQDWVTKVVLPAIRKDGAYVKDEEKVATGEMSEDEFVLKAMTILQGKVERLTRERDEIQGMYDHKVNNMTIGEFLYDVGEFLKHGDKIRMAKICKNWMSKNGRIREERPMRVQKPNGEMIDTKVYVYPREALEVAYGQVKALVA